MTVSAARQIDGRLLFAVGSSLSTAVATGISAWASPDLVPGAGPIDLIMPAAGDRLVEVAASTLVSELRRREPETEIRERTGIATLSSQSRSWLELPAPSGADRFATIRVPAWWRDANRLCLVSRLPGRAASSGSRPLAVLAALAHRRQRWAAHFSPDRAALNAELASPWHPRLIVMVGTHQSRRVALFARDLVAAELVWVAIARLASDTPAIAPWEDAAVQRATFLDLGVSRPGQLALTVVPADDGEQVRHRLAAILGIERGADVV